MRRSSWVVVGLIVVLIAGLAYLRMASRPQPSDEEQVQALLTRGQFAIEHKDLKDALSCISRDYSDSAGLRFDTLRLQGARGFQEPGQFEVTLENTSVAIKGDRAQVEVDVALSVVSRGKIYSGRMGLSLRKEASKHWLVIPVQAWKVTEISGLTPELTGGNAGF